MATGSGFLLYSEQALSSRFVDHPPYATSAAHLIVVRYVGSQWCYDTNDGFYAFSHTATDVLLAEIDFGADTILDLVGIDDLYYGIARGYADGDLAFAANQWNGQFNDGEFGVSGSYFNRNR